MTATETAGAQGTSTSERKKRTFNTAATTAAAAATPSSGRIRNEGGRPRKWATNPSVHQNATSGPIHPMVSKAGICSSGTTC